MNLSEMTLDQLNALSDELDLQLSEIRRKKKQVAEVRRAHLAVEHAAYYGLTPEEYQRVKETAREQDIPLTSVLSKARKSRAVQVVKAGISTIGLESPKLK